MNLRDARDKGKLKEFIREQEKKTKPGSKRRFTRLVKNMTSQSSKPTPGTSRKGSGAS